MEHRTTLEDIICMSRRPDIIGKKEDEQ